MSGDRSREHRRLAAECLAMARQTSDTQIRAYLVDMAQRWLDLDELAEHDPQNKYLRRRAIQAAIGEGLKSLYGLSYSLPPHFLALLAQLNAEIESQTAAGTSPRQRFNYRDARKLN
jgi:hypothetical protein